MPRKKKDGSLDKRSSSSANNVARARARLAGYIQKGKKLRQEEDEPFKLTDSDFELSETEEPPKPIPTPEPSEQIQPEEPPSPKPKKKVKKKIEIEISDDEEFESYIGRYKKGSDDPKPPEPTNKPLSGEFEPARLNYYQDPEPPVQQVYQQPVQQPTRQMNHYDSLTDRLRMRIINF